MILHIINKCLRLHKIKENQTVHFLPQSNKRNVIIIPYMKKTNNKNKIENI